MPVTHPDLGFDGPIPFPRQYLDYFQLFNERDFFEAHEVLEDLWIMETSPARNYYKGLIMVAVAILHWQRGNTAGAYRLYRDGMIYLEPYPATYEGFDLGPFRDRLRDLFRPLAADPKGRPPAPPESDLPVLELRAVAG